MGIIKELIKSFIDPMPKKQSFDELAGAAGIEGANLAALNKTREGVSWKFDEGIEETERTTGSNKVTSTTPQELSREPKRTQSEKDLGREID